MYGYHISQSNEYTFRIQPTASAEFTMSLQDMTTLQNFTGSIVSMSYTPYESYVSFSLNISGAIVGEEYRAVLYNSGSITSVWNGSFQTFASASLSIPKSDYENQNKQYVSHQTENRYVILD
jgi:hypothetical protein